MYNSSILKLGENLCVYDLKFFLLCSVLFWALVGQSEPVATSTAVPTDTPIPSATPVATPTVPLVILVLPADLDAEASNLYQKTVYDLSQEAGLRFQLRNSLSVADVVEPGLQVVIVLPPDPGVVELAAAAPGVQFLAINIPEVTAGGNISVLGGNTQSDIAAFLAGYTASMITDDYRIGMLMPKDNNDAIRAFNAYANGMKFQCGLCRPFYYLNWSFPQYLEISAEEDKDNYDAYADILILQFKVRTIYIHPDIYTEDLVNYIGTTGTGDDRDNQPGATPCRMGDDHSAGRDSGNSKRLAPTDRWTGWSHGSISFRAE